MKRLLWLLLPALLLTGCSLRNRRSSEEFVPSEPPVHTYPAESQTTLPADPAPVRGLVTVYELSGSYTDYEGRTWDYVYRLPLADLPGEGAAAVNREIDSTFRPRIQQALAQIDKREPLTTVSIDFDFWENGDLITLVLTQTDPDGGAVYTYYSLLADGSLASRTDLLVRAGWDPDAFDEVLTSSVEGWYTARYGSAGQGYGDWLNRTLNDLADCRVHLDREGRLAVLLRVHTPDGAVSWQELVL